MRNWKGLGCFGLPGRRSAGPGNVPIELRSDRDSQGGYRHVSVADLIDNVGKTFPNRPQHFWEDRISRYRWLPESIVSI
jgi:hypothetical protein